MTALLGRPHTVLELAGMFKMSQPAVTKHLNVLEDAGLISRRKVGRYRECDLLPQALDAASAWIERCRTHWEESFRSLERYLDENKEEI